MRKLKIVFLVPSFPTTTETFIVNQITYLIDRGHDLKIFAFTENRSSIIHQKILDYHLLDKTIYLNVSKTSKIGRYFDFLNFVLKNRRDINFSKFPNFVLKSKRFKMALTLYNFLKFRKILENGPIDIFHCHFGQVGAFIGEMKSFGFSCQSKLVVSFHGYDISPHLLRDYKKMYSNLFREADMITVNTHYTKKILQTITHKKIEILPVGLDTKKFVPGTKKQNSYVSILFVGRLIPLKAPDFAIKIVKELLYPGKQVKLCIVGEGVMYPELQAIIRDNHLEEKVELKGALTQEKVVKLMAESNIFLFPGKYDKTGRAETQGLVIQEAQAMELPVIISDVGGMKYGLLNNKTGFVVESGDILSFVSKIETLIKDHELRTKMGRRGRKFVVENYDSEILGTRLENLYYKIR